MKIACTTLAAVAGTLAFTGSAAAFDRDALAGNEISQTTQNQQRMIDGTPVFRAADFLVERATEDNVPRHPSKVQNAPLPIALGDCGDCSPTFVTDNISPFLGGGATSEPLVDLTDPFFVDNGFVNGAGSYDDNINDNYFDTFITSADLREVTGPSTICGFHGTYLTLTGSNFREGDTFFMTEATLAANDQGDPVDPDQLIRIRVTTPYDLIMDLEPANNSTTSVSRISWGNGALGGLVVPRTQPFGTCEALSVFIDLEGLVQAIDPAGVDLHFSVFTLFIAPDGEPADPDYSIEFFAPPPLGACCVNGVGSEVIFEDCQTAGGVFWGINTVLSQDGGLDGGVVCETCTLDPAASFYEGSSDTGTADDVANATDFNAGCGDFAATGVYNPTPYDVNFYDFTVINEALLGNRWVGTAYNFVDVNGDTFNDIDYYEFTAAANGTATVSIEADNPTVFQLVALGAAGSECDGPNGTGVEVVGAGFAGDSDDFCTDSFLGNVVAGQKYAVLVAPASATGLTAFQPNFIDPQDFINNFFSAPELDASANENLYAFQVDIGVEQTGVCCFVDNATIELEADCDNLGGFFQGPATTDLSVCCPDPWSGTGTLEGEDEVCGVGPQPTANDPNDGCADDNTFTAVIPIAAGEVINGETTTYTALDGGFFRDRDVYTFSLAADTDIDVTFTSQALGQLLLFDADTLTCIDGDFDNVDVIDDFNTADSCETSTATVSLTAGNYAWFVSSLNPGGGVGDPAADCNNGIPVPLRYALSWTPAVACNAGCTDVDGNGTTELADLLAVLADFGQVAGPDGIVPGGSGEPTNIDCDAAGNVELADLLAVLAEFGNPATAACP